MMECKGIEERLSAYLEGAVSLEEKRLIEEHLNSCPQCSTAFQDLKKTGELVRDLEEVEPPAWVTQKIMARVRAENERKGGIWRKLFYPLHIKVPIETLATVLVAVIAVYVFRAVEPEMKSIQLPPATGPSITGEEAPKPSREPEAESLALRGKTALKEHREKDTVSIALTPPAKPSLARPAGEPPAPKTKESPAERPEEGMQTAGSLKKQELAERRQTPRPAAQEGENIALSDAARDTRERKKLAAAPMAREAAVIKPGPIDVSVAAKDVGAAGGEVEKLLGQFGARKIEKKSHEGREVLTAEIGAQNLKEFLEKLKAIGEVKEKSIPLDIPEGDIAIRVQMVTNP